MGYVAKLKRAAFFTILATLALVNSGCSLFVGETVDEVTQEEVEANRRLSICGERITEACKKLYCCLTACVTADSAKKFQDDLIKEWRKQFPETSSRVESRHKFSSEFSPASKCQTEVI